MSADLNCADWREGDGLRRRARKYRHCAVSAVGDDKVGNAIGIEIGGDQAGRELPDGNRRWKRGESAAAIAEEDADASRLRVSRGCNIGLAVAVEVTHGARLELAGAESAAWECRKGSVADALEDRDAAGPAAVGDREIGNAVEIEIANDQVNRRCPNRVWTAWRRSEIAGVTSEQDRHVIAALVRDREILFAVAVEVAHGNSGRLRAGRKRIDRDQIVPVEGHHTDVIGAAIRDGQI